MAVDSANARVRYCENSKLHCSQFELIQTANGGMPFVWKLRFSPGQVNNIHTSLPIALRRVRTSRQNFLFVVCFRCTRVSVPNKLDR